MIFIEQKNLNLKTDSSFLRINTGVHSSMTNTTINTSTKSLLKVFENRGYSVDEILSSIDVCAESVFAPQGRLEVSQMSKIWSKVYEQAGSAIGLQTANIVPIGAYGVMDYLSLSSPTFNDSLLLLKRFYPLINSGAAISVQKHRKLVFIELCNPPETPPEHLKRSAEYTFAILLQRFRSAIGRTDLNPFRIDFTFSAPQNVSLFQQTFQSKLRFDQKVNQIVFERDLFGLSLIQANAELAERLKYSAEQLLSQMPIDNSLVEKVRNVLRASLVNGNISLKATARTLAMSERDLQRKLLISGTHYQAVSDGLRCEVAFKYLSQNMDFREITYLLGFSETSALSRAFKNWTGKTPLEIKKQN